MHYTTSCNTQSSVPEDGQNNCPKHVELTGIINKSLLLLLFGCLCYLYQWCTVKQISDNEIYLIKYIKSVLWRVAKPLSYVEDARCLKVKDAFCPKIMWRRWQVNKIRELSIGGIILTGKTCAPWRKKKPCLHATLCWFPLEINKITCLEMELFVGILLSILTFIGARGSATGWGTALQSGRSRVRFPMVHWNFSLT